MRCSCPPSGWPDPDCKTHGLADGQTFPPMDRHAMPGEDAKAAQRRLYLESVGKKGCVRCGRVGFRWFEVELEHGAARSWRCRAERACGKRRATSARRVRVRGRGAAR